MTLKSPSMPFNKILVHLFQTLFALLAVLVSSPLVMGATEINIGVNNTVNTGKIVGGNCKQGSNKLIKKQITVESFKKVVVEGVFVVNVTCGKEVSLAITADDNLHSLISAVVKDGALHLGTTGSYCTANSFVAEVTLPELASLSVDGSSELALVCSKTPSGRLDLALSGASSMKAAGKVSQLQVIVQDSSELDAYELAAETVTVKTGDAATARLTATKKLTGQTEDASTVTYRGQPKIVNVSSTEASECSPDE